MKKDKSKKNKSDTSLEELNTPELEELPSSPFFFDETDSNGEDFSTSTESSDIPEKMEKIGDNDFDFVFSSEELGVDDNDVANSSDTTTDEQASADETFCAEPIETVTDEPAEMTNDEPAEPIESETIEPIEQDVEEIVAQDSAFDGDAETIPSTSNDADKSSVYDNDVHDGASNVRIGKTVVDTLIVNNMLGGKTGGSTPVVNVTVAPEKKANVEYTIEDFGIPESVKGNVVSAKGEQVLREYRIVKSAHSGKAIVTNRRLIIDSDYRLDMPIEKIAGITSSSVNLVNVAKIVFGALFIGLCLFLVLFDFKPYIGEKSWLGYLIISLGALIGVIGLILILTAFKKQFAINIYADGLMPIMTISSARKKAESNLLGSIIITKKGKDFDKFTGEIGALLVQTKDALSGDL